ncbi:MAG TPA: fused MFS/spermidine synthase [Candidatus Limnocylindrales bacterium]|nr:fused MFS/spermidine synthase [Candidatus Limnocylindrales bacterium]
MWTTAIVFFQTTLLAGYAWTHLTLTSLGLRRHAWLQIGLAVAATGVLLTAPLSVPAFARPPDGVATGLWLALILAAIVGLPFFVLATASPTTQRWFAAVPGTSEPYRLFAASNAGSLIGLIAYPTLVEPNLDLPDQARWWSIGFAVFAAGTMTLALIVRRSGHLSRDVVAVTEPRPVARRRAMWVLLAAVPAALLIGVTTNISTDIAAVPFLWVVPLTIYLATLILAYLRPEPIGRRLGSAVLPVLALAVALRAIGAIDLSLWQTIGLLLATLAAAGLALHGRLAADRPSPVYLTSYSLYVALGGTLGGVLTGIVAPLVFRVPVEGLLVIAAAVVMVAGAGWLRLASIPSLVAILVAVAWSLIGSPDTIRADRSFYGVYRVDEPRPGLHVLVSGTTIHGRETFDGPLAGAPLSYYHRAGPLGEVIESMQAELPAMRFGAVGLGAGAIAAYGRPTDTYRIAEIDATVVEIARDPASFTFLADSAATIDVVVGDGRLDLETVAPGSFDLLVLDAFSSDTVPVHLLTVESFATSMRTLAPRGVIAVHISNRFIDLEAVVAAAARDLGFVAIIGSDLPPPELSDLADASQWVVVGRSFADLAGLVEGDRWRTAHADDRRAWTDRYSDLLGALRD